MSDENQSYRRKRKLIKPAQQLRISGIFCAVVILAASLQALLLSWSLAATANRMPTGGEYLVDLIPSTMTRTLLVTLAVILPLVVLLGVLATFKLVGPVHRIEQHLRQVVRGEDVGPCKIRRGDAFQELCGLVNEALDTTRAGSPQAPAVAANARDETRAA